jgi:membrane protein
MIRIPFRDIASLLRVTTRNWLDDRGPRLGAALAYYMALSLAPSVVIILAVAGLAFDPKAAQDRLILQIQSLMGKQVAAVIETVIQGADRPFGGFVATTLGLFTLFFGATAMVSELRDSLNTIWKVPIDTTTGHVRSIVNMAGERLVSFAIVLGVGFLLLGSLFVHSWISDAGQYLSPVGAPPYLLVRAVSGATSFLMVTALFALAFKFLPSVPLKWADVVTGAVFTALLFMMGRLLLKLYLGAAHFADSYGTAGSLVVFLVWVYYSAQVLYFGAEFTRAYSLSRASVTARLSPSGKRGTRLV